MAANNIIVKTPELQKCANDYAQCLNEWQAAVKEYNNALNALRSDWTGKAFAIMSSNVMDLTSKIVSTFARISDAVNELHVVEQKFETNEQNIKSRFVAQSAGRKSPFIG